ncbi:MAG: hypothetical protein OEU93_18355 [Rubrivivax sp.]|nr:hypothetical protein [Rubrivivax sp.]
MRIVLLAGVVLVVVLAALNGLTPAPAPALLLLVGCATVAAVVGWVSCALTVRIRDGALQVRFGLGWPRKTLPLAGIAAVEVTRTTFLEGWGLHRTRRGWLYNVSGFDAVLLRLTDGHSMMIGTDEPRRLKTAIERARARG